MGCTSSVSVPERKIVLLGKSGVGKSSAGNTILGENIFTTTASASNAEIKYQKGQRKVFGRKITIIDTPGVFDAEHDEETKSELVKSLIECAPAVDAFIIVLEVGRYTKHENSMVQNLLNTLKDEHVLKHTVILLTHGEQLEGKTIEEFMKGCSELQELVHKCGGRCYVIDNKYWNKHKRGKRSNRVQVKKLVETIDELVKENGCYTNELLQKIEKQIQEEVKMTSEDNVHPEERHKMAKTIVHSNIMERLVGVAAGAIIGALIGVKATVTSVLSILQSYLSLNAAFTAMGLSGGAAAGGTAAGAAAAGAAASSSLAAVAVVGVAGVVGGIVGAITGWKATEESESVSNAIAAVNAWGTR